MAAPALASLLPSLDPQNIVLYEWLPSFLQKTPPKYAGEGMGKENGRASRRFLGQGEGVCGGRRLGGLRAVTILPLLPFPQDTALSWTPASPQSSWPLLSNSSLPWCLLAST